MSTRQPKVEWIDITTQEPKTEVLAIGQQEEMMIGYCSKQDDQFVCEGHGERLAQVTHWMDLGELRVLRRLQVSGTIPG